MQIYEINNNIKLKIIITIFKKLKMKNFLHLNNRKKVFNESNYLLICFSNFQY